MAWLSQDALDAMNFAALGRNVLISDSAHLYNAAKISIGDHTRIDDFCVISAGAGGVEIGNHVHIAVFVSIIGAGKISIADYCGVSARTSIYSSNDDYSGAAMTNPTIPPEYTAVTHGDVSLGKHVLVGAACIILPGVTLHQGVAVGAMSLVNRDCAEFGIYSGVPAKRVKERKRDLLALEENFVAAKASR